jgi:dihydroorotate dehydrogenase
VSGWRSVAYSGVRPLLFRFEAERIHRITLAALTSAGANRAGRAVARWLGGVGAHRESVEVAGLRWRNRVGVGAGFDKDALALRGWAALGLGFAEVGTVTPLPQAGNPRPRVFRLTEDEALINRMGFNNAGAAAVARNVMLARRYLPPGFVVGVNVGLGRDTPRPQAIDDYLTAHRLVAPVADYLAVNISSPNTPGLRELQEPDRLRDLLRAIAEAGDRLRCPRPLLVKLAPDLDDGAFESLVAALADAGAAGVVVANTTLSRDGLRAPHSLAAEPGGLSGAPLRGRMLELVACGRRVAGSRLAIIASGGIGSGADAAAALGAGADLVQLWTGLVYRGPRLIGEAVAAARGRLASG